MAIDIDQLLGDMKNAASEVLNKDVTELRGFSERQLKAIAQQTALVEGGILSGQITEETRDFLLDSIEDMVRNFAETLRGLMTITIEKVCNAIVGVLWQAIEAGTSIVLPIPDINTSS
jgi:hypothetical protein